MVSSMLIPYEELYLVAYYNSDDIKIPHGTPLINITLRNRTVSYWQCNFEERCKVFERGNILCAIICFNVIMHWLLSRNNLKQVMIAKV